MFRSHISRSIRKSILSSLSALGASRASGPSEKVLGNKIIKSLAAAAAALAAEQSAQAGTIVLNPNETIGHGGAVSSYDFGAHIASMAATRFKMQSPTSIVGVYTSIVLPGGSPDFRFHSINGYHYVAPASAGQKYSTVGIGSKNDGVYVCSLSYGSLTNGFSDAYIMFSYEDFSSATHYGWIYGSAASTGPGNLTFDLLSWAYDTTPNEEVPAGETPGAVPEPATFTLGAMAALVLGAAGIRRWKKTQQAAAAV